MFYGLSREPIKKLWVSETEYIYTSGEITEYADSRYFLFKADGSLYYFGPKMAGLDSWLPKEFNGTDPVDFRAHRYGGLVLPKAGQAEEVGASSLETSSD